jgi:4-hydroxy-tetrahydrodipicolinate reductase
MKTTIGINGACGRMGLRVVQLAHEDKSLAIGAAFEAPSHPDQGRELGDVAGFKPIGVSITSDLPAGKHLDVVIDFSLPAGTMSALKICLGRRIPLVIATTGHSPEQKREIEEAAHETAILMAPNMSLAMNVLMKLLAEGARALKDKDFDVEIIERHHRFKKDSPSGTALHLAKIVQGIMGQKHIRHGREGLVGERPGEEIGIHAVRVGDNVGEHTVIFTTLGETLELVHKAHSRDCYVRGALQAAKFLANRPAGWYSMADVLGV